MYVSTCHLHILLNFTARKIQFLLNLMHKQSFILVCIIVHLFYIIFERRIKTALWMNSIVDLIWKKTKPELKQNSSAKSQLHFKSLLYYRWGIQILRIDIKWTAFYTHTLLIEYISSLIRKICAPLTAKSLIPIFTPYYF